MAALGDLARTGFESFGKPCARCFRAGADVEDEDHVAGDHIAGARRDGHAADGGDDLASGLARKPLTQQHRLRGTGERIAAQHHRHRAGVARFAQKLDVEIGLPDDRGHHAERLVARFQHRPLLDVDFDVGRGLIAPGRRRAGCRRAICRRP